MAVTVYAPASIGNVSVGFDLLGAAISPISGERLGDCVTVDKSEKTESTLSVSGPFASSLPGTPRENIVFSSIEAFRHLLAERGVQLPCVDIHLDKNLPVGSGLGSSASSIVAALHAVNELFENPLSELELCTLMGEFEGKISGSIHYDNIAPCFTGGLQLMYQTEDCISKQLPVPKDWYWVCAYSGVSVSTAKARAVLPENYSLSTAIDFSRRLSIFVDALHRNDWKNASEIIDDVIAEPYRTSLLPSYAEIKPMLMDAGALASGISGSGPTVFAVADKQETAEALLDIFKQHYLLEDSAFCHICKIDEVGARVVP